MSSLENGYYRLAALISREDGVQSEHSIFLYVSDSDVLKEPNMWLQNTSYEYNCGTSESMHVVLKNDSGKELDSLEKSNGIKISPDMYKVLENGRVIEISSELFNGFEPGYMCNYDVVCKDGSRLEININGV